MAATLFKHLVFTQTSEDKSQLISWVSLLYCKSVKGFSGTLSFPRVLISIQSLHPSPDQASATPLGTQKVKGTHSMSCRTLSLLVNSVVRAVSILYPCSWPSPAQGLKYSLHELLHTWSQFSCWTSQKTMKVDLNTGTSFPCLQNKLLHQILLTLPTPSLDHDQRPCLCCSSDYRLQVLLPWNLEQQTESGGCGSLSFKAGICLQDL